MSTYIDFHVVQTVPPSCVNRDDTGSPKTAIYGGTERARVSSQAWKHAMRSYFKDIFAPEELGTRTKMIPGLIASEIMKQSGMDEAKASKSAIEALKNIGIKVDEKEGKNAALFFISRKQIEAIAALAIDDSNKETNKDKKKDDIKKAFAKAAIDNPAIDILLFGRMVADDPSLNYDATAQVAHAISTHTVHTEYDYFTAVDDEQAEDNAGAGHLGTVEFNSSTLYRYATINLTELWHGLGEDTAKAVIGFAKAFVLSMPTGKQNTFANRTLPDMVYITVRNDQPVNLVGAYEKPIRAIEESGYVNASCETLLKYADKVYSTFTDKPVLALGCGTAENLANHAQVSSFTGILDKLGKFVSEYQGGEK